MSAFYLGPNNYIDTESVILTQTVRFDALVLCCRPNIVSGVIGQRRSRDSPGLGGREGQVRTVRAVRTVRTAVSSPLACKHLTSNRMGMSEGMTVEDKTQLFQIGR